MATYVLIPGADGRAWYWHRLVPELRGRGHEVVAVDLPQDNSAGLSEYADSVVRAIGDHRDLVLVAQSLAGFTAPLVCERVAVDQLILVNAMVPAYGETAGQWWDNTGQAAARAAYAVQEGRAPDAEFDVLVDFFHDVPPEVTDEAMAQGESGPSEALFTQPWPQREWPKVPTRFLQGREDRFFPLEFQRRIVKERLGITVEELPGGHLVALSRPSELADLICRR
ncbi:alpha/beta hydrolase [Streptomyces lunaelactis]|uniref:Alpha/beta hydrolase n=1 Tax=Streptomyces lunaelactis TaxID=1535768 RepID=A0A2R4TCJ5_9ACTN|nr:alpha/beta hydrolase [Streptomyces lunaelactis]AVZ76842.1 alpha/beta hydrolase [Streptomyces lunaelactis]NUK06296.1 alpha/beta hydrolase [Streptomyces lunaelactis]NUK20933.1 alpha/beta hydrolase [Streptomyces lunaelactis]NUK28375.1 alpha/beta hydrolase [Streptomyces lunaelactis]NUK39205.1 alpha/beta hydrolase [Streptomyces lunaelactis]